MNLLLLDHHHHHLSIISQVINHLPYDWDSDCSDDEPNNYLESQESDDANSYLKSPESDNEIVINEIDSQIK